MPIETGKLAIDDRVLLLVFKDKDFRFSIDDELEPPEMAWRMATVIEEIKPLDKALPSLFRARADDGQTKIVEHLSKVWQWPKN